MADQLWAIRGTRERNPVKAVKDHLAEVRVDVAETYDPALTDDANRQAESRPAADYGHKKSPAVGQDLSYT